jgi:hypothetical protein
MITGANTNVRHRGIVFHVQTEDSGRANPHIISHLYHHGTILASEKTDYAEHVGAEDLETIVRGMIDAQHGRMLAGLKAGEYDALIDERLEGDGPATDGIETPTPSPAQVRDSPARRAAAARERSAPNPRAFGEGIVSQKPLDEVILEYLAEKARGRADRADKSAHKSRSSG